MSQSNTRDRAVLAYRESPVKTRELTRDPVYSKKWLDQFAEYLKSIGVTPVERLLSQRQEHKQYNIGPGTVSEIREKSTEAGAETVVLGNILHPGQYTDLSEELSELSVIDYKDAIYEGFKATSNPIAQYTAQRRELRRKRCAIKHSEVVGISKQDKSEKVIGDIDARLQSVNNAIKKEQKQRRDRIKETLSVPQPSIAVASTIGLIEKCKASQGQKTSKIGQHGEGTVSTETVNDHEVYIIRTAPIIPEMPEWYQETVPRSAYALDQADIVLLVRSIESVLDTGTVKEMIGGSLLEVEYSDLPATGRQQQPVVTHLQEQIFENIPTTTAQITLPINDDAMSFVSTVYGKTSVNSIEYGDQIKIEINGMRSQIEQLKEEINDIEEGKIEDEQEN